MRWLQELATAAGGEQAAQDLLKARGIGLILKKIDVDFKVCYQGYVDTEVLRI